jgi:hypothetical protein
MTEKNLKVPLEEAVNIIKEANDMNGITQARIFLLTNAEPKHTNVAYEEEVYKAARGS